MNSDGSTGLTVDDVIVEFNDRVRKGYDPSAVDAHLQAIARGVAELRARVDDSTAGDESLELVLRATRRSVDEALTEARARADQILEDAAARAASTIASADAQAAQAVGEAETRANYLTEEAEARAATVTEEAEARSNAAAEEARNAARHAGEEARERHAELGRLLEVREVELAGLDDEIERRQDALRHAGSELLLLADGFVDLREPAEPAPETDSTLIDSVTEF